MKKTKNKQRLRFYLLKGLLAAFILTLPLVQACNAEKGQELQDILDKVQSAMNSAESYRMLGGNPSFTLEAEYATPGKYSGVIETGGDFIEFILVEDKGYIKEPDSSRNTHVVISPKSPLFNNYLSDSVKQLIMVKKQPDETIDGMKYFHYAGTFDIEEMLKQRKAELDETQQEYDELCAQIDSLHDMEIKMEMLISKENYTVRKIVEKFEISGTSSVSTWTYFDYGIPSDITAPLSLDGELLPGWKMMSVQDNEKNYYPEKTPED